MKFFRKYRFKILVTILICILLLVSYFMLWIHVPYTNYHNQIDTVKNQIIANAGYQNVTYFHKYATDKIYYILCEEEGGVKTFVVYDEEYQDVYTYTGEIANEEEMKEDFFKNYNVEAYALEIGYEEERLVYRLMYKDEESLIYRYYSLTTGQRIRDIRWRKA